MSYDPTQNYGFRKIDYFTDPYHEDEWFNWDLIDGLLFSANSNVPFVNTTGSSNAYVATYSPAITSLTLGLIISGTLNHTNTGAATINVNGLGAKSIKINGQNATANQLIAGMFIKLVYDGTSFHVIQPLYDVSAGSLFVSGVADILAGTITNQAATPKAISDVTAWQTLTDGASITTDGSLGVNFQVTLGGNRTMAAPTNLVDGRTYTWKLKQDATGSRTLTWNAIFDWGEAGAPTLNTAANKIDIVVGIYCAADAKIYANFRKGA